MACRRSISAQSAGAEHVISVAVSFSTQRNAEMSSFEPSRIPAWLAPVCEERSVSHSVSRWVWSASQRAMVGALPSRNARRSTGRASPSISRKTIPGTSVRAMTPCLCAIRRAIRNERMSSVSRRTANTTLTTATTRAARRAQPKLSTVSHPFVMPAAACSMSASATSTSTKPNTSVSGSRSAASTGGMTAFRTATMAAMTSAPLKSSTLTPGRTSAAAIRATAEVNQVTRSGTSRQRGRSCRRGADWSEVCSGVPAIRCLLLPRRAGAEFPAGGRMLRRRRSVGLVERRSGPRSLPAPRLCQLLQKIVKAARKPPKNVRPREECTRLRTKYRRAARSSSSTHRGNLIQDG